MKVSKATSLTGRVPLSGDKSIAHRALLLGALAAGTTRIANVPASDDLAATLGAGARFIMGDKPEDLRCRDH